MGNNSVPETPSRIRQPSSELVAGSVRFFTYSQFHGKKSQVQETVISTIMGDWTQYQEEENI